jgi:hypothetical protein
MEEYMTKDERLAKSEAARKRRNLLKEIIFGKTQRYLNKLRRLKKIRKKKMRRKQNGTSA